MSTLSLAFLVSFAVGSIFFHSEQETRIREEWWTAIGIAVCLSVMFWVLGYRANKKIFRKEALAVVGIGWILASLVGALPYYFILEEATFADSVFESASGITTTGSSVFTHYEAMPRSLLFWRCMSQWIGGLGVVVFFVGLLSSLGAGAKILYSNEASAHSTDLESGRIQKGVIQIMLFYLFLSLACTVSFLICGMGWFDAICHMFTTVSTGGFSTYTGSIASFQSPAVEWVTIVFMALGATSFIYCLRIITHKSINSCRNTEVAVYYAAIVVCSLLLALLLWGQMNLYDFPEALRTSTFTVVSIITTTGFTTADYQEWLPFAHTILLGLMVTGGCSGSTSGGTKLIRVVIAIKVSLTQVEKAYRSHVVRPLMINGRVLDADDQNTVMRFLVLLMVCIFAALPIVSLSEVGLSLEGAISAVFATLFNIGPGFAEVGPSENFGFLNSFTKLFLSLLMVMGRLELLAILVLFSPSLWKRFS